MSTRTRRIVAASISALFLATSIAPAVAAPVVLPQNVAPGFFGTNWDVVNTGGTSGGAFGGSCDSSPGLTIQDGGGPLNANDAYDNAYNLYLNGAPFVAPGGNVDRTGTTITAGPVVMSGLNVTVQYYFSPTSAVARMVYTLQNPTAAPIAAAVQIPVNFGSDGGTVINATSSGDTLVTTADRWVVSSDGGPGDSVNLTVMAGPGALTVPLASVTQAVFSCAATNGLGMTYNLNVPAGATQSVMLFAGLEGVNVNNNTVASSITAAALFNSNATLQADWLAGMSAAQLAQVVNWNFGGAVGGTAVPTLSEWGLMLLAAMMGLFGLRRFRRQPTVA